MMKRIIKISFIFFSLTFFSSNVFATTETSLPPNNNNKEQAEVSGKEPNGKYSFTLFNFFNAAPKPVEDSTAVKKPEPANLPKVRLSSGL